MKLYYAPGACSLSPHIVAREARVPLDLVKVDTRTHRTERGGNYYEVNPFGYVPVLEMDDGALLREGSAIVQFLADRVPDAGLIPAAGTLDRVRVHEWLNFIASEYHQPFIWLLRGGPDEVLSAQRVRIGKVLSELDGHLQGRKYMLGQQFTVVDAYAYVVTRWCYLERVKVDLQPYVRLQAFMARVAARPAVKDALCAEGLTPREQ
jgi:glutathione S-transferase